MKKEEDMAKREGLVTMGGNPLTLVGDEAGPGDEAPDFIVVNNDLGEVKLGDYKGKVLVISSAPSLDTPICELQTKKFNEEAGKLGDKVRVLTISMDLPFAQKRWCAAHGVDNLDTLSDHKYAEFGKSYGMLIHEHRLLARGVFVIDAAGKITYSQLVDEIGKQPDYKEVMEAVNKTLSG